MQSTVYSDILQQIDNGYASLFLGAGSTRNCRLGDTPRGLTGDELAKEILRELNGGTHPGFTGISLMQASEFYVSNHAAARSGLDRMLQKRLADLRPTVGHYLSTAFPWRAIVTTNYNRVTEDAWAEAHASGYSANEIISIKTDADIAQHQGDTKRIRLYKPHGCITTYNLRDHRMVLTSSDYFESERIRGKIFEAIRSVASDCSTIFAGYSLSDYTFKNIFFRLYQELGQWASRSYAITPIDNPTLETWMARSMDENFKTRVLNETFDTFMIRLTLARGKIPAGLKRKTKEMWPMVIQDHPKTLDEIPLEALLNLPEY
ncbi:MAG: SIR2 family protein [Verrucomicrobia bacterium]|nr:SIR2 family protein [Verrucomicrobiota bacterium]